MENRLYVGNLSDDVSPVALKKRFAEFGEVVEVQLPTDRASGRLRGHAFVTMLTDHGARAAIAGLNGASFDERQLRVSVAGEERDRTKPKEVEQIRITTQFRERFNMAYELDCMGMPLTIEVFPEGERDETWRVEATAKGAAGGESMTMIASARTKALALEEVASSWSKQAAATGTFGLDWAAVTVAMSAVRAIRSGSVRATW